MLSRQYREAFQIGLFQRLATIPIGHQPLGDRGQVGTRLLERLAGLMGQQSQEGVLRQVGGQFAGSGASPDPAVQPGLVGLVEHSEGGVCWRHRTWYPCKQ